MPSFVETRKLIQVAAVEIGARVSGRQAKHLAGQMLTQCEDYSTLTYSDPTALAAVHAWMKDWCERMDPEQAAA